MAEWTQTNILDSIKGPLDIRATLDAFDSVLATIEQISNLVAVEINVVQTIAGASLPDLSRAALTQLRTSIADYLAGFSSSGHYLLPIFPPDLDPFDWLEWMRGGYSSFETKIVDSINDIYDVKRPAFGNGDYTAGLVIMVDSGNPSEIFEAMSVFNSIFNITGTIKTKSAIITNLVATPGDGSIKLNWEVGDGLPPTFFRIQLGKSQPITIAEVPNTGSSLEYIHTGLINDLGYTYIITPVVVNVDGNPVDISSTPNANKGTGNRDTSGLKRCSNLICEGENKVYKCATNNKSFNVEGNTNAILCFEGANQCFEYLQGRCKYNNGTKCLSAGVTSQKSNYLDLSGVLQSVPNTTKYHITHCLTGKNGQECDGYTAQVVRIEGTAPNWENISLRRFFPREVDDMLTLLNSFVEQLFQGTSKANDQIVAFTDLLGDMTVQYASILTYIRQLLNQLDSLLSASIPTIQTLEIPPQSGGINNFLATLQSADNQPITSSNNYTVGFILLFGSSEQADVELAYATWKQFFSH